MTDNIARMLAYADEGLTVASIAQKVDVSPGYVYKALRDNRPGRARKVHARTSSVPKDIRKRALGGQVPSQIAKELKCSRAYVYRVLSEDAELRPVVAGLHSKGYSGARIAALLMRSRADVDRILGE